MFSFVSVTCTKLLLDSSVSLIRFQRKTLDVVTLFHRPQLKASMRALAVLKQVSAEASETATEDQASDHSHQNQMQRSEFELDVTEDPPTSDQLRSILEYVGERRAKDIVSGSKSMTDAMRLLKEDSSRFKPPVVREQTPLQKGELTFGTDCRLEQW